MLKIKFVIYFWYFLTIWLINLNNVLKFILTELNIFFDLLVYRRIIISIKKLSFAYKINQEALTIFKVLIELDELVEFSTLVVKSLVFNYYHVHLTLFPPPFPFFLPLSLWLRYMVLGYLSKIILIESDVSSFLTFII